MEEKSPLNCQVEAWESKYANGEQLNIAPFDEVVSFVFKNRPDKRASNTRILEVGCGAGNNAIFLAKQGFEVTVIDSSATAVRTCAARAYDEKIYLHTRIGKFAPLPFNSGQFDLVIDRAALSFAPPQEMADGINEINRCLILGGKFLFTPYAAPTGDSPWHYTFGELKKFLPSDKWDIESVHRASVQDYMKERLIESHWRIIARKI